MSPKSRQFRIVQLIFLAFPNATDRTTTKSNWRLPLDFSCFATLFVDNDDSLAKVLACMNGQKSFLRVLKTDETVLAVLDLSSLKKGENFLVELVEGPFGIGASSEQETLHCQITLKDLLKVLYRRERR
ncbi:unnamed protein product [Somion occarium]|uniref:Uncharacterized protein n=1 Tax=Somion occarium TaxID=3059160 RepID=A0ABP1DT72_9APHY